MAQTPKSISANLVSGVKTTLYTVPAGATAIVKTVTASPIAATDNTSQIMALAKNSGGVVYPITTYQNTYSLPATGASQIFGANLLTSPLTLAAGESLEISQAVLTGNIIKYLNGSTLFNNALGAAQIYNVAHNGTIYMAVGRYTPSTTTGFCATSTDGITWTELTAANSFAAFTAVEYISAVSTWFAISGSSLVISTNNGVSWSLVTAPDGNTPTYLAASATLGAVYAASASGSSMWTSSNGSTWTVVSNFGGATGAGSNAVVGQTIGMSFDGNRFVISQTYATQSTAAFSTYTFLGCCSSWYFGFGQATLYILTPNWAGINYSSNYTRYYQAAGGITTANTAISRSSLSGNSNEWSYAGTVPASVPYGAVQCAGTNTVLIAALAAGGSTTRARSTDGNTFTASTDIRSYTGAVFGLDNGYFYTFAGLSASTCYASTDPTTSNGTLINGAGQSFYAQCGAADPISGAWVIFGCNTSPPSGGTQFTLTGATALTGGAAFVNPTAINTETTATNGGVCDVCWSPGDSRFYCTTRSGTVYYATAANAVAGTWTLYATCGYSNTNITNIAAGTNTVYLTTSSNNATHYYWRTTPGNAFSSFTLPFYQNQIAIARAVSASRPLGNKYMSSNGANITVSDYYGRIFAFDTTRNRAAPASIPPGIGRLGLIGSILFAYGGYSTGVLVSPYGVGFSYDFGYYSGLGGGTVSSSTPGSKIGFVNGTYYVIASTTVIWYSTNTIYFSNNATISTTAVLSAPAFTPYSFVNVGSGTSSLAVSYSAANNYTFKVTSTATPLLGVATATVSAVEIT